MLSEKYMRQPMKNRKTKACPFTIQMIKNVLLLTQIPKRNTIQKLVSSCFNWFYFFSNDKCVCLGIPGGSIMFGSHSNFYRRIIWIGIFVIFLGLTVAQVSDMAEIAFSFPTDE